MIHSNRNRSIATTTCVLGIVAIVCIWIPRQHQQATLNRAMITAIENSNPSEVEALLVAGADPNTFDTTAKQETPFEWLRYLMHIGAEDASPPALMVALTPRPQHEYYLPDTPRIVKALVHAGANVNANGQTPIATIFFGRKGPLLNSSETEPRDLIECLIGAGADTEVTGPDGETPLTVAACVGWTESVRTLLAHGANVNPKATVYGSPLYVAERGGYANIITMLLAHGAKE